MPTRGSDSRAARILEATLGLPAEDRDSFARSACEGDDELFAEVVRSFQALEAMQGETVVTSVDETWLLVCGRCGFRTADARLRFCPSDQWPLVEDPAAKVGTTLDDLYVIEALIGQGGMGAVYGARHVLLEDTVAVKVLPRHVGEDPVRLRRFQIEGAAARRFRHPGAVAVYDLRTANDGTIYLVQELVVGKTLRETLAERGSFAPDDALHIVEQIAAVLDAAHAAGVVHRDLKPDNAMLVAGSHPPTVKVLDLGIAKLAGMEPMNATNLTQTGAFIGTPVYMSPEQWGEAQRDGDKDVDGRSDVYSLGVIAYELLVGRPPFVGPSLAQMAYSHAHDRPTFPANVSGATAAAVGSALAKDRSDRFATAGEFAVALRQAIAPGPTMPAGSITIGDNLPARDTHTGVVEPPFTVERGSPRTNLPQEMTSFVGRESDVANVTRELTLSRFVTLTGTGGVGKTRLAIRVASTALHDNPDGVWLVELAALSDPSHVSAAIAGVLGIKEERNRPLIAAVTERLESSRALLVLDNCEHLVDTVAEIVDALLRACPSVRVVATSRETLKCAGETVYRVPSLGVPEQGTDGGLESAAVRLFMDRALQSRSGFAPSASDRAGIVRLVGILDGIPLAIELAAARVRMLSIDQLLDRMDDCFRILSDGRRGAIPRQQTLRAAIDWSYALLDDRERAVLRRLSVFAGGCTLEAAEAVCAADVVASDDVLDLLTEIADKSLLTVDYLDETPRYRLLQTIRHYGEEKLEESGEVARIEEAHSKWFLEFAERARSAYWTSEEAGWFSSLEADHENLRTALRRVSGTELARFCRALGRFWELRSFWTEGRGWLEAGLASAPSELRAEVSFWLAAILKQLGEIRSAHDYLQTSIALQREAGDRLGLAQSLARLGSVLEELGDLGLARTVVLEAYEIAREDGHTYTWAGAASALGSFLLRQGEYDGATRWLELAIAGYRSIGHPYGLSVALLNLGTVLFHIDDRERAEAVFAESLSAAKEWGDRVNVTMILYNLAYVAISRGDLHRAESAFTECLEAAQRQGSLRMTSVAMVALGRVVSQQGRHNEGLLHYAAALEIGKRLNLPALYLDALEGMAITASLMSRHADALLVFGAASTLRSQLQQTMSPAEHEDLDKFVQTSRDALGGEASDAALDRGRAMDRHEALSTTLAALKATL